jgi:hypothetical protein
VQGSSPVTAAGPRRFFTGFPIIPYVGTRILLTTIYMQRTLAVKGKIGPGQLPESQRFKEVVTPGTDPGGSGVTVVFLEEVAGGRGFEPDQVCY